MKQQRLIGPFCQLLTMDGLSLRGSLSDAQLEILSDAGILIENGLVTRVDAHDRLLSDVAKGCIIEPTPQDLVALPGFIDPHTHIAFGGSRAGDFAKRLSGMSYLEIAKEGGGIWDTVTQTRQMDTDDMVGTILSRVSSAVAGGVTTMEVKSGYGLSPSHELKLLQDIRTAGDQTPIDLIPTCLAAHTLPKDFSGSRTDYLNHLLKELIPQIQQDNLTRRMDIFVEEEAFVVEEARGYLEALKRLGFDLTIHGDQFTTGGSVLGVELGAVSVDHLEVSGITEIDALAKSETVATVLPGASLGLGVSFAPVRQLLDRGAMVAFGSDWNPGSAPMGDFLTEVCLLAAYEKITSAEALAGMTFRAARALRLDGYGILGPGFHADIVAFPCRDFRELLYHQGALRPAKVWKKGMEIYHS